MKVHGFRVMVLLVGICVPSLAQAFCSEPRRYSFSGFEDQVNGYIDYLLCLHNEQVGSINDHARLINQLGNEIAARDGKTEGHSSASVSIMRELVINYTAMETENEQLRKSVAELEARIAHIEGLMEVN